MPSRFSFLFGHDLFGKPLHTFPDHALDFPQDTKKFIGEARLKHHLISRRAVLAGSAATGALALTGMPAFAELAWKKYAGTKLEVMLAKGPRGDNLQKYIKEFSELSGIEVESEQIPEQQQRQKVVIELASG
jgi:hypothetical protein